MKQRILRIATVIMMIMSLTLADFLVLCADVVSYASSAESTNVKNVEFRTYFKDESGKEVSDLSTYANNENMKLYFQISVKQEGYFNGNITLENSNFKFKTNNISNDVINKVEDNKVYFNQINADETKNIEMEIEIPSEDRYELNKLNMKNVISLEGVYRDSKQKDIAVKAKREVGLNIENPYFEQNENAYLTQEVITNTILNYGGEEKRIVQIRLNAVLQDNLYPMEELKINVQAPKMNESYPEKVLVNTNDLLEINGKTIDSNEWKYNEESGLVEVDLKNEAQDNKIMWIKNSENAFIITYIYDKNAEIENLESKADAELKFYNNDQTLKMSNNIKIENDEKNAIASISISQSEDSIYKGKLSEGLERKINYKDILNINLDKVADEFIIKENKTTLDDKNINSYYERTTINKESIQKILGDNGILNIINAEDESVIATINKDSKADDEGNLVVEYPQNVKSVLIKVSSAENIGKVEINTTKVVKSDSIKNIQNANSIKTVSELSYMINQKENKIDSIESVIGLKNSVTSVGMEINRTELSAMTSNENVEFRVTLNSKNEENKLFKNPVIRLQLPEKIEKIELNSVNLIYEDELEIKSTKVLENNVIEIQLSGKQTHYKEEAIDGAIVIVNANLSVNRKTTTSEENIILNYINDSEEGQIQKNISIVSYAGMVAMNRIKDTDVENINNKGNKELTIQAGTDAKNLTIENEIINNEENTVANVKILGQFPTKEAGEQNNIEMSVSNEIKISNIDSSRIKIYYSENKNADNNLENVENKWTENIENSKNVKKYLILVDKLDVNEEIKVSYEIEIPEKLDYNLIAKENYNVSYVLNNISKETKLDDISIATLKGAVLETELKALVAGQESNEVKENEIVRYETTISNTGSEAIKDAKVKANVPDGTTFINTAKLVKSNNSDEEEKVENDNVKDFEFSIDELKPGEKTTKYYEVKINEGTSEKQILNKVVTEYGDVTKDSNEVKTEVKKGSIEMQLTSVDTENEVLKSGYAYRYVLKITNHSDSDLKKVKTTIDKSDVLNISEIYYINSDRKNVSEKNKNEITIDKIQAGETITLTINANVQIFEGKEEKDVSIVATCEADNNKYSSNEITLTAKSDLTLDVEVTSANSNSYVNAGDKIQYNIKLKNNGSDELKNVYLKNGLSNNVTLSRVLKSGTELAKENYTLAIDNSKKQKVLKLTTDLKAGETVEYTVEVVVNMVIGNRNALEIINTDEIGVNTVKLKEIETKHILKPEEAIINNDSNNNNGNNNENNANNGNNGNTSNDNESYKIISGTAWLDENENGIKDANEKTMSNIVVKLLNVETNEFVKDSNGNNIETKTDSNGFYSFTNVVKGKYIVVFEYDTEKYGLAIFQKDETKNTNTSKVISKTLNGKDVAVTEVIEINAENIANINIGLINAKKYDLKLDKYISKVTVQNNKTVSKEYSEATLVKQEIDAKQVNSTTVIVEYTIKVTNNGDVGAYVKKIVDYLPNSYKFTSELNKDWYQSGSDLYCTSLANEEIKPGESREIKLVVIKNMTEQNTGLINNTAEILESYNEYGLKDINSTEGNKVKGENDMGSADLIISIKTGQVIMTSVIVAIILSVIAVAIYVFKRLFMNGKML